VGLKSIAILLCDPIYGDANANGVLLVILFIEDTFYGSLKLLPNGLDFDSLVAFNSIIDYHYLVFTAKL
jgi:hypothetical protein